MLVDNVEKALFAPGDKSILPFSPPDKRAGKSPWKAPLSSYAQHSKENLIYAFAEAQGWTPAMEDRHLVVVPLPGRPAWSLFGVFDGHGGSTASSFLSEQMLSIVSEHAARSERELGGSYRPEDIADDSSTTPELLHDVLTRSCMQADEMLSRLPRMKVESKQEGAELSCLDRSGSTGTM
jgi:serine/threonine protein phosphatase PrpC